MSLEIAIKCCEKIEMVRGLYHCVCSGHSFTCESDEQLIQHAKKYAYK